MSANEKWKEHMQETNSNMSENGTVSNEPFNWPRYLQGLGIAILIIGCILTIILIATIVIVKVPGYYTLTEFSVTGLVITIATFIGVLIIHAVLCWLAEMLRAVKSIRKKLG